MNIILIDFEYIDEILYELYAYKMDENGQYLDEYHFINNIDRNKNSYNEYSYNMVREEIWNSDKRKEWNKSEFIDFIGECTEIYSWDTTNDKKWWDKNIITNHILDDLQDKFVKKYKLNNNEYLSLYNFDYYLDINSMFSNDLHNAKKDVNIMIEIYKKYFINDYNEFDIVEFKKNSKHKYTLHWNLFNYPISENTIEILSTINYDILKPMELSKQKAKKFLKKDKNVVFIIVKNYDNNI